ncbi:hypothetical protein [Pseudonocardia sp.]|uniref:hypothetical protein n=1 Tax=Pseudonocardia sp. TaxID=60912 RepID=UPI003D0D0D3F
MRRARRRAAGQSFPARSLQLIASNNVRSRAARAGLPVATQPMRPNRWARKSGCAPRFYDDGLAELAVRHGVAVEG